MNYIGKIIKWILITFGLFILGLLIVPFAIRYNDYAVDRETNHLPYRTYYYDDISRQYDFYRVLFSTPQETDFVNYRGFTVLSNLETDFRDEYKNKYIATLNFESSSEHTIQILPNTIVLEYRSKDGTVIPYDSLENDVSAESISKYNNEYYKKIYDKSRLPDEVEEYVYAEVLVDGELKIIESTLPLEKVFHYSWFDVMMGV